MTNYFFYYFYIYTFYFFILFFYKSSSSHGINSYLEGTQLLSRECPCDSEQDYSNIWLDVVFILDSSDAVASQDFEAEKTLLEEIAKFYTIGESNKTSKYSRIAILNTAQETQIFANFSTFKNGDDMSNQLKNLRKIGGLYYPSSGLSKAMDIIYEENSLKIRTNIRKVIILFSSITIDCEHPTVALDEEALKVINDNLCQISSLIKSEGITLITIATKLPEVQTYPVVNIAEQCYRLKNDEKLVVELIKAVCLANCYCPQSYTQYDNPYECTKSTECVFVNYESASFDYAKFECNSFNETLSDIFTKTKDDFIRDVHISKGALPYWIGLRKIDGGYVWGDGTKLSKNNYTNWGSGQPNASNGDCVYAQQTSGFNVGWFTDKCNQTKKFFSCQRKSCTVYESCGE